MDRRVHVLSQTPLDMSKDFFRKMFLHLTDSKNTSQSMHLQCYLNKTFFNKEMQILIISRSI